MDRDYAIREVQRMVAQYRGMPFDKLSRLADSPVEDIEAPLPDGLVTFTVEIRKCSRNVIRVNVSALGHSCFKLERIEESTVVHR